VDNGLVDTGRSAIARMNGVDPFLEPGRDVLLVGRFDGVRNEPSSEPDEFEPTAVISLFAYFEASPIVVE
jgi:hypothetical protein